MTPPVLALAFVATAPSVDRVAAQAAHEAPLPEPAGPRHALAIDARSPGLAVYRIASHWEAGAHARTRLLCQAPCTTTLPAGDHALAIGRGTEIPLLAGGAIVRAGRDHRVRVVYERPALRRLIDVAFFTSVFAADIAFFALLLESRSERTPSADLVTFFVTSIVSSLILAPLWAFGPDDEARVEAIQERARSAPRRHRSREAAARAPRRTAPTQGSRPARTP